VGTCKYTSTFPGLFLMLMVGPAQLVPRTRNCTVPRPNTSEQANKTEEKKKENSVGWSGMECECVMRNAKEWKYSKRLGGWGEEGMKGHTLILPSAMGRLTRHPELRGYRMRVGLCVIMRKRRCDATMQLMRRKKKSSVSK
jgi:hypothetical protein